MSDIDNSKEFYGLVKKSKLNAEEERIADDMLARIRERQRRDRKEQLYSYPPGKSVRL